MIKNERGQASNIIPLLYINGHTIMRMEMPTAQDYEHLVPIDLTLDQPWLDRPKPTIRFDITKIARGQTSENIEKMLQSIHLIDSRIRILPVSETVTPQSRRPPPIQGSEETESHDTTEPGNANQTMGESGVDETAADNDEWTKRKSRFSEDKWLKWKQHLYLTDDETLDRTLQGTTQLAALEHNPELTKVKQHGKRRLHKLSQRKIKETFYTDPIVSALTCESVRGYKYTQVFIGKRSHYIYVYHLKKKSEYYPEALCNFITYVGIPEKIISDNAGEEVQKDVKTYLAKLGIKMGNSEPHHQQQNFAEQAVRDLKSLFYRIMSTSGAPQKYWCYALEYATELMNCKARKSLQWRTPAEYIQGDTPDISQFYQFMFWQKVRFVNPGITFPNNEDNAGRFLGLARTTGDALTYTILDDREDRRQHTTIVRSAVLPDFGQNKNITRLERKEVDSPRIKDKTLFIAESPNNKLGAFMAAELKLPAPEESNLLPELQDTIVTITDRIQKESVPSEYDPNATYICEGIVGHRVYSKQKQVRMLWKGGEETWESLHWAIKEVPEFVIDYVERKKLGKKWIPRNWLRLVKMVLRRLGVNPKHPHRRKTSQPKEMFGFRIPRNPEEAIEFDKQNGNTLWQDAMQKEIDAINSFETFQEWKKAGLPPKSEGWQFAPARFIFTVKHDGRHKARYVIGGHVTDASDVDTYAATVRTENVRLIFLVAVINDTDIKDGDIDTAYLNAISKEKIYTRAGIEFGPLLAGKIMLLYKALYGAKGSGNAWFLQFSMHNAEHGFKRCKLDSSVWFRLDEENRSYDYLCHHVDDYITVGQNVEQTVEDIKKNYTITETGPIPEMYLGINTDVLDNGQGWLLHSSKYLIKAFASVENIIGKKLGKASTPTKIDWKPELDDTPLIDEAMRNKYQKLMGIGIWLITTTRIDITYAITTLSRYTHIAREGHFTDLIRVFEYLHKFPTLGIRVSKDSIKVTHDPEIEKKTQQYLEQIRAYYPDAEDQVDKDWPEPLGNPIHVSIYVDSDHAGNREDRRSITGIIAFLNSMPYRWFSKRQTCVEASTFGAEFSAMRTAVEEAIAITHTCKSLGIPLDGPVEIFCDNRSVVDNATIPGSALKKKHTSIAFHMCREAQAAGICVLRHIPGTENPADILTKALPSAVFWKHVLNFMEKATCKWKVPDPNP